MVDHGSCKGDDRKGWPPRMKWLGEVSVHPLPISFSLSFLILKGPAGIHYQLKGKPSSWFMAAKALNLYGKYKGMIGIEATIYLRKSKICIHS